MKYSTFQKKVKEAEKILNLNERKKRIRNLTEKYDESLEKKALKAYDAERKLLNAKAEKEERENQNIVTTDTTIINQSIKDKNHEKEK